MDNTDGNLYALRQYEQEQERAERNWECALESLNESCEESIETIKALCDDQAERYGLDSNEVFTAFMDQI